jgi:hypothetical protein
MHWLMDAWSDFTDTLNTRGGTIALLFVSCLLLGFGVLHVMHHGDTGQAASVIISTFSGFGGALLLALTQKDVKSTVNGNGITSTTSTTTTEKLPLATATEEHK